MNKKIFRRVTAIFTAVCILMFEMCSLAGNSEIDIKYTPEEQATIYEEFEILKSLKITGEYENSDFLPYDSITLGEFYGMVLNIAGECSVKNIRDIEEVKTAAGLWGKELNESKLDSTVSCADAVKVLLELTGNIYKLERNKKYPTDNDYMTEAARVGILDGMKISSGKVLNRITAMQILLNTVDVDFTEVEFYSNGQIRSIKKTERTVIEEYRDIYIIKGTVTQTADASLYGETEIEEGFIEIDGNIYKTKKDYDDLLGYRVEGYAQYVKSDMETLLYLEKSLQQKVIEIDAEDIKTISENLRSITYYQSGKTRTVSILPSLRVIYNGAHLDKFTAKDLLPKIGKLVLIDNNNDGKHEVMCITDYKVFAVASLNSGEETIYGRIPTNGDAEKLYYGDYERVAVYKNGEPVKLSEIKRGDVLSAVRPKSFEARLKIYISDKTVTGTVQTIDEEDSVLTVEGSDYKLSEALLSQIVSKNEKYPQLGKDYVFHLDILGKIVYCDYLKENELSYAFMREIFEEGSRKKSYQVRIFTTDGKWYTRELAEKVRLNGNKIEDEKVFNTISGESEFTPMLIMFGLNSDGKVVKLETPIVKEGVDEERLISGGKKTRTYKSHLKSLDFYDVNLGADTQLMVVPDDTENEDAYLMMSTNILSSNTSYLCTPYNLDKFRVPELVIMHESTNLSNGRFQSEMCVVTKKIGVCTPDGYSVEGLKVNSGSYSDLVITAADGVSFADIKVGDVISAKFNNKSEAEEIRKWYSSSDGVQYLYPATTDATNQILSGRVQDVNDDRSIVRVECDGKEYCMRTMSGGTAVAFYNYETNEARTGTFAEVAPGDFIVFKMTEMLMNRAVVIENLNYIET